MKKIIPAPNQNVTASQDSIFVLEIRIQLNKREMAQTNMDGVSSVWVYLGTKYKIPIINKTPVKKCKSSNNY